MFKDIRAGGYPKQIGKYKVKSIWDLTEGFDDSKPENKPDLPVSKSSEMITFTFENGCVLTLRTSGTEPKIKYYSEYSDKTPELAREVLADMIDNAIIPELYQPEKFGFSKS